MKKYRIKRGDSVPVTLEFKLDGVEVPLAGYTPKLCAKARITDTAYLFNRNCDIVLPDTDGIATVTLTPADTITECKNAIAEALLEDGSGNQRTYLQFLLDIEGDVNN